MSERILPVTSRASALARQFDDTFARALEDSDGPGQSGGLEDLLGLHVADEDYAVRMTGVAGLLPAQRIVPLPGPLPELLGVVGLRGKIVPTYSLAALLGHAPAAEPPTWVILVGGEAALGLAFDQFTGYVRIPRADIFDMAEASAGAPSRTHVNQTARVAGALRGIIDVQSIARSVTARSTAVGQKGTSHVDVR